MLRNISPSIRFRRRFLTLKLSSFIYFLHFFVQAGVLRGCVHSKGVWKRNSRPGEGNAVSAGNGQHVIEILTFLTAPGFPSALCQGHDYHISACALPAAACSNSFIISEFFV